MARKQAHLTEIEGSGMANQNSKAIWKASVNGSQRINRQNNYRVGPSVSRGDEATPRGHAAPTAAKLFSSASTFSSACAALVDDAGFWPVINRPSTTENGCQSRTFSKMAPSRSISS